MPIVAKATESSLLSANRWWAAVTAPEGIRKVRRVVRVHCIPSGGSDMGGLRQYMW